MTQAKHVLIAEDTDGDFFMLRKAFTRAGLDHVLHRVRDGVETLAYLTGQPPYADRKRWPVPDLLILDLLLPGLNGLDALTYLRRELKLQIPVVVLSASLVPPEMKRALQLGASDYFVKPITFTTMIELVKTMNNSWLSESTNPKKR
jgi:CheY-like chemotaxis protein